MYCANLKEVQKMSQQFIKSYGLKTLREDYETAVKNNKLNNQRYIKK